MFTLRHKRIKSMIRVVPQELKIKNYIFRTGDVKKFIAYCPS